MEIKFCSNSEHQKINAIKYCVECKIYMCNKCEKLHSGLFNSHNLHNIDKDFNDIFINFSKEDNHYDKLEFFCKTHNKLCCSACIAKVRKKGKGQHSNCDVCIIEDIKKEKKNIYNKNIIELENLSISLQDSINKLKENFEKINKTKEELKIKIQKIFTEIRNQINNREDEILLKVDEEFDKVALNENKIKEIEKLPNKVKLTLEKGKNMEKEWNDDEKLSLMINHCLNIENDLKNIELIKSTNIKNTFPHFEFKPDEKGVKQFLETIKYFGNIYEYKNFIKNPISLNNLEDYKLSGENNDIITRIGSEGYRGTLILDNLEKDKEYKWKIKLLNSRDNYHFEIGVASSDFDINQSYQDCGWYYYVYSSCLDSGPPHNYSGKVINYSRAKSEITVIMNMPQRTLKFLIDDVYRGECFNDIPVDKPLYPAIFMYYNGDSLQFIKC